MKNKIKKYSIAAGAVFLALLIIIYIATRPTENSEVPVATPTPLPNLRILSISPEPPVINSMWSTEPIIVKFNKPLAEGSIVYTITPETPSRIDHSKLAPDTFKITPQEGWTEGTLYTITIDSKLLVSTSGDSAAEDIEIKFRRIPKPSSFLAPDTEEPFIERY